MGLFTPEWQGENNSKAISAIENTNDQKKLVKMIEWYLGSGKYESRAIAVAKKITDTEMLRNLVCLDKNPWNKLEEAAFSKLFEEEDLVYVALNSDSILAFNAYKKLDQTKWADKIATEAKYSYVREEALNHTDNPETMAKAALADSFCNVRIKASERVNDPAVLEKIALNDSSDKVRNVAIQKLTDEETLYKVTLNDSNADNRSAAVKKMRNQEYLSNIASSDSSWYVRKNAAANITDHDKRLSILLTDESKELQLGGIRELQNDDERLYEFTKEGFDRSVREESLNKIMNGHGDLLRCICNVSDSPMVFEVIHALTEQELIEVMTAGKKEYTSSILNAYQELKKRREPDFETLAYIYENTSYAALKESIKEPLEKASYLHKLTESAHGNDLLAAWNAKDIEKIVHTEPIDVDNVKVLLYLMDEIGLEFDSLFYGNGHYVITSDGEKIQKALKELYLNNTNLSSFLTDRRKKIVNPHIDNGNARCHEDYSANTIEYFT